jgi:hypothetical protein
MSTTLGSWAFVGAKATKNSAIVQLLVDSGLIILGKGNMTVSIRIHRPLYLANQGKMAGIRRHENDNDDVGMVKSRWTDAVSVRWQD